MATKAKTVVRHIDLPPSRVREIVISKDFLLQGGDGGADGSAMRLSDGVYEVNEDGSVRAAITATSGEGDAAVAMAQATEVSAVKEDDSFTVFSTVPLPRNLGTMATNQIYSAQEGGTLLESTVAVEVAVALVGKKIAEAVLAGVEASTTQGVERILRLAGE